MQSESVQQSLPQIFQDSELYKLQIKQSSIQGAGMGLFATAFIQPQQYIAQYYGAIIPQKYSFSQPFLMQDKMVYLNTQYCVISRSPSSRANDIVKWEPQDFMKAQNYEKRQKKELPLIQNKNRNAQIKLISKDKAFIKANRLIQPGQQIFIDYGYEYWQFFFKAYLQKKQKSV